MTFIELVRRTVLESGITGLTLGSTQNQRGEAQNFINWVQDAYLEIQGLLLWPSLWEQATVTISAGQSAVAQGLSHARYVKDSALLSGAELDYMPWDDFRLTYRTVSDGVPSCWTIRPDRSFAVSATVEADTAITVERYRRPAKFVADTDVPALFDEHHMMIVWRALQLYAGFDEAGALYQRATSEYNIMKRLAAADIPRIEAAEPLA